MLIKFTKNKLNIFFRKLFIEYTSTAKLIDFDLHLQAGT